MVIEWLKVKVEPELRETYIQKDAEIWTAALATCKGFMGKEVWISPTDASEVVLVIRWATKEDWKAVPKVLLDQLEQQFAQQMGASTYHFTETGEYQIRKFS